MMEMMGIRAESTITNNSITKNVHKIMAPSIAKRIETVVQQYNNDCKMHNDIIKLLFVHL